MRFRFLVSSLILTSLLLGGVAVANDSGEPPRSVLPAPSAIAPQPTATLSPFGALPWMGVAMDNGGDTGVRVEHVIRGSPADRGGIRAGDRIVAIDGTRVTAPGHVTRTVGNHKVGETVTLGLERTGTPFNAAVVLAVRPSSDDLLRMDLVGAPAPNWSNVTALSGAPSSMGALKGKVALLDFWASWCGPCRMVAPRLSSLKDRLGSQGLSVVGITTDEAEQAAIFSEKFGMRYPVVVDKDGDTSRAYGITGLPTMILVDKKGVVRDVFVGFDPGGDSRIEVAIKKLLAEPAAVAAAAPNVPPPAVARPDGR